MSLRISAYPILYCSFYVLIIANNWEQVVMEFPAGGILSLWASLSKLLISEMILWNDGITLYSKIPWFSFAVQSACLVLER